MTAANPNQTIRAAIRTADAQLLERHPWLGRDDAVAAAVFLVTVSLTGACIAGWAYGAVPTLLTICLLAILVSVFHEMEHDLIHDLYLHNPIIRDFVLVTIWVAKASLDPWKRGRLHLWHHAVSGQEEDFEERLIGLGMPWGPLRVLITLVPPASLVLMPSFRRAIQARIKEGGRRPDLRTPEWGVFRPVINGLFFSLPVLGVAGLIVGSAWAWPLMVLWVLPNLLRHASIVIMSSNSHYMDIERGVLVDQNQILDHWIFWPLQVFCWNFGATHVVHHFFVRQPFWRRTLVFSEVRQVMVDQGVRANDFGSFSRANRIPA
jgi:fatty acid desaturase